MIKPHDDKTYWDNSYLSALKKNPVAMERYSTFKSTQKWYITQIKKDDKYRGKFNQFPINKEIKGKLVNGKILK